MESCRSSDTAQSDGGDHWAPQHLPQEIQSLEVRGTSRPGPALKLSHEKVLAALSEAGGNKSRTAEILGVGRTTLYRFLRQQGLTLE